MADRFRNTGKNFSVVEKDNDIQPEAGENRVGDLGEFHFIQQGITSDHIHVTLKKFTVTASLRAVRPPDRLDLVSFERERDLILMLNHKPGERNSKVIP